MNVAPRKAAPRNAATDALPAKRRHGLLRRTIFRGVEETARLLGGRRFYRWHHLSRERLVHREVQCPVEGLPAALDGFRVLHVSDPHGGSFVRGGDLAPVADLTQEIRPDVVCWTGDYIVRDPAEFPPVRADLARCTGRLATFAVFGNHDYKDRRENEIAAALAPSGWRFLRNACVGLEIGGARVAFGGIEDAEEGLVVDLAAATACFGGADLRIALTHAPAMAPAFAARDAHAVLAGHTHANQIDLPVLRRLGPRHPGLVTQVGGATLFVTRGLGAIGVPLRIRSPAEVCSIVFRRGAREQRT